MARPPWAAVSASGAGATALDAPSPDAPNQTAGGGHRAPGIAQAGTSPAPVLAYEPWLQAPGAPFSIGNLFPGGTAHFAIGDFDGDGMTDFATGATVWLNQGGGSFTPRTVADLSGASVAADFDGDGLTDLAVRSTDRVTVLHAVGGGDFEVAGEITGFDQIAAFVVADMDRDGRPDVVVVDGANVTLLMNRAGTLVRAFDRPGPAESIAVAVGDFVGDARPDVVVSSWAVGPSTQPTVTLYPGTPGGLGAAIVFPLPPRTSAAPDLTVADLDGDGNDDLVAAKWDSVSIWWGGDDLFSRRDGYPNYVSSLGDPRVIAGDIDHDGRIDIAVSRSSFGVAVYHNLGDRRFEDRSGWYTGVSRFGYSPGDAPRALAFADLDGDGLEDWLWSTSMEGAWKIAFVHGLGNAVYAGMALYPMPFGYSYGPSSALIPVDFDRRGRPDLLTGNESSCWIMRSRDDGGFDPARPFPMRGTPRALELDPDNRIDLVGAVGDSFYVYRSRPDGTLHPPDGYAGGRLVDMKDVNGDGWPDAVQVRGDGLFVRFNDGHARFDRVSEGFPATSPVMELGDLDGDGRADLVLGFTHRDVPRDSLVVLRGLGDGSFAAWQRLALFPDDTPYYFHPPIRKILIADLDADGDSDVVAVLGQDGDTWARVDVLVNSGRGSLVLDDNYDILGEGPKAYVADFTGDGLPDLATLSYTATGLGRFQMRFNTAGARFDDWAFQYLGPGGPYDAAVGDFNADGMPDLACLARNPYGDSQILVVCYNVLDAPAGYRPRRGQLNPPGLHATPETRVTATPAVRLTIERVSGGPQGVSLELSLPSAAPARLDVFDVSGRRMFTRRLDGQAGRFSIALPREATRASGIYWARLSQDGARVTRRIPILN